MAGSMRWPDLPSISMSQYWLARAGLRFACLCVVAGSVCTQSAWAQAVPTPGPDNEQIYPQLEHDATIETRLDVDFDGDGRSDTLFVAQSRTGRKVIAMQTSGDGGKHRVVGVLQLSLRPLVPAQLSYSGGLLSIADLTGDDTATQVRYQFKFDHQLRTFRLAALDVGRYSRKRRHDSVRLNWEPDSGRQMLAYGRPSSGADSEAGYRYGDVHRTSRAPASLTMERTPTGDEVLTRAGVRLGQGVSEE